MLYIRKGFKLGFHQNKLFCLLSKNFGGTAKSHHDDHDKNNDDDHDHDDHGHHEEVVLNQRELIENKNINKEMVSLFGFKDINDENFHEFDQDPYAHLRNYPALSIFFNDPFYVNDEDEPLMNEPHGYLTSDDPLDVRNNYEIPALEYLLISFIAIGTGLLLGYQGLMFKGHAPEIWEQNYTAEQLDNQIRKIRIENDYLVKRKQELQDQLNQ